MKQTPVFAADSPPTVTVSHIRSWMFLSKCKSCGLNISIRFPSNSTKGKAIPEGVSERQRKPDHSELLCALIRGDPADLWSLLASRAFYTISNFTSEPGLPLATKCNPSVPAAIMFHNEGCISIF